jgi:hypothetical protein
MAIVPNVNHDSAEVTLRESVKAASADAADLAAQLTAGAVSDPSWAAQIADRLSEELAEAAQMLRSLPGRPVDARGHDWQLLAALRTADAKGEDVAETVARALARLAAELGSSHAVLANRPGSWEAAWVAMLLHGTVGEDDGALDDYRTTRG